MTVGPISAADRLAAVQTLDLTHPLQTNMPVYPGTDAVAVEPAATRESDGYRTTRLDLDSHAGTHVDAPSHLVDGPSLADFPPERFRFAATTIDCRPLEAREPIGPATLSEGLSVGLEDVDLVVAVTGWDDHWGTDRYFDHPYLTGEAVELLAEHDCDLGVDTINPDPTPTEHAAENEPDGFPVHETLFESGRVILENLRGLDRLPDRFECHAYPLRFANADASTVRAVAVV